MGIQEDLDMDIEPKIPSEKTKYIVVKNHVREIPSIKVDETSNEISTEVEKELNVKKKKSQKIRSSSESENSVNEISENDLNELRTVYKKCKAVIKKIETKYGHLLQISDPSSPVISKHRHSSIECHCGSKRRIVYDDEGQQVYRDVDTEHHICHTNVLKPYRSSQQETEPLSVSIEDETSYDLPESIPELTEMLHKQNLRGNLRHQIMRKMKYIRQDHINSLRYEKPNLIEKLKSKSTEIFEFEGSNLSSLPGYPVDKIS